MTDKEKCKDKKYAGRRSIFELVPEASQLRLAEPIKHSGIRVNLLALGDVGATLLMALKVLGGGLIERIGIYDVNPDVMSRFEIEMNQIGWPFGEKKLPEVVCLDEEDLFDCDMFVFCASKAVPPIGAGGDVRMVRWYAPFRFAPCAERIFRQ